MNKIIYVNLSKYHSSFIFFKFIQKSNACIPFVIISYFPSYVKIIPLLSIIVKVGIPLGRKILYNKSILSYSLNEIARKFILLKYS